MNEFASETLSRALSSGAVLGHYEIAAFVGAGGMGEVYRAHDRRLGRDVAVKVLPNVHDADGNRVRRFMQEARTTGKINHPNVVSIYDVDAVDGRPYLVTEFLEGETLRSYLQKNGALTIRQVIEFGLQIARGLAAAHDKGVIHRDLKPANVFITRDGHLKILDFGLAKLIHPEWERGGDDADTISALSIPGTILGSAGYMSPEQIEARSVDHRADIFAFGVILYEMLTGTRAFSRSSVPATLGAILNDQPPDIQKARPTVPPTIATIVRRCMEKRPEDRFQSARDLAFSLEELMTHSGASLSSAAMAAIRAAAQQARSRPALTVSALAVLLFGVATIVLLNVGSSAAVRDVEPDVERSLQMIRLTTDGKAGAAVRLSGDGKYAVEERQGELWLIHIATGSRTRLVNGGASVATFSPDGNYIYFAGARQDGGNDLLRIPLLGGATQAVIQNVSPMRAAFTRDGGRMLFSRSNSAALFVAAANGTAETKLAERPAGEGYYQCAWSPDSARILCSIGGGNDSPPMVEVDPATGRQQSLSHMPFLPDIEFLPDGKSILGLRIKNELWQIVRVTYPEGKVMPITKDVNMYYGTSMSRDGSTVATIRQDVTTNLWAVDVETAALRQLTTGVNTYDGNFGLSSTPDGRIIWASGSSGRSIDLWIADADGSNRRRLTNDEDSGEKFPVASGDGKSVVYVREASVGAKATTDVWRMNLDGTAPVQLTSGIAAAYPHFTADSKSVLFTLNPGPGRSVYEIPATGGTPRQLYTEAGGGSPSPDGKWFLVDAGNGPGRRLELRSTTSTETRAFAYQGMMRRWKRDATAFAFIRNANIWIQDLSGDKPRQLTRLQDAWVMPGLDWMPDGRQIVFSRRSEARDIVLLKNIF
jgi:Tol biopolymer transport system component